MSQKKLLLLLLVALVLSAIWLFDLQAWFSPEYLGAQRDAIFAWRDAHYWLSRLVYFCLYVLVAALSLPAAALITVAGGAVFGFWWALLLVSFASTIGATLAFLLARTLFRDWVQQRFGTVLEPINRGIEKDGVFYLFTLRLVPLFPFVLVNLVMGLTPISTAAFYAVSQLGMLFGTALYVNVGVQLGLVASVPGVLSVGVIRAIVVLAIFPWLVKALLEWLQRWRLLRNFVKPKRFDNNLLVIGGGSAGLVTAYIAAMAKAKVTLVEQQRMGGDCLNTGCVPSKTLLRSAAIAQLLQRAPEFGVHSAEIKIDFPAVMRRVNQVIATIAPHDSTARYESLGVQCIKGTATIKSPWSVEVDGRTLTARAIVIATGARPAVPDIPGLQEVGYYTSDTIWQLAELPQRLLVLGAGPAGCELAQAFARLGSKVTMVNRKKRVLPREDVEVSAHLETVFAAENIKVLNQCIVTTFRSEAGHKYARVTDTKLSGNELSDKELSGSALQHSESAVIEALDKHSEEIEFDAVLLALGRTANTEGLGLDALGIGVTGNGSVVVNEYLQTAYPTIYACGDVVGPYQFTHMAAFQAWYASINSLFGRFKRSRISYRVVPRATFVDPEIARVGLNECEASVRGIVFEVTRFDLAGLDRAIADGNNTGFVKVLTVPGKDRLLGVTIVGSHAAELLAQFTLAMTHGLGLKKILNTTQVYPTYAESGKFVAGVWRKQHTPQWLYPWLEKLHRWQRGN